MAAISAIILISYIITSIIVVKMGFSPGFPWNYMVSIGLLPIPLACYVAIGGIRLEQYLHRPAWLISFCGLSLGFLLVIFYRFDSPLFGAAWLVSIIFTAYFLITNKFNQFKYLLFTCLLLMVGYTIVRNLNYIALSLVINRLKDSSLYNLDMIIYSFFLGPTSSYNELFPLVKSKTLFNIFQNAYFILFFEMYVIVFINIYNEKRLISFVSVLFSCYVIGILLFVIYPAVGPYVCYPESFALTFRDSMTYKAMQGIVSGYNAVKSFTTPTDDIGYFVSFPSLHVAIAIILQYFMCDVKLHYWIFFPVNCLVIISTVFLGFHYLIDIPAGILLALLTLALFRLVRPKRNAVCTTTS